MKNCKCKTEAVELPKDHLFKPGQSGNPAGKKKGTRNKTTLAVEALIEGEAETLGRKTIELALAGDTTALRMCLDRVCPLRKGAPVTIDLPAHLTTAQDVAEAISLVVQAVANGEISPDEGGVVSGILETRRKAIETVDLENRLTALEQGLGK